MNRKTPATLIEIVREGIGPLHTASSRKKRKAHEACDALLREVEDLERYIIELGEHWSVSNDVTTKGL